MPSFVDVCTKTNFTPCFDLVQTINRPDGTVVVIREIDTKVIEVVISETEYEEMEFEGECQGQGQCECMLSPEVQEMADAWKNEPVPEPIDTGLRCQGKIKGGKLTFS